jgi:hypothetical protein
MIQRLHRPRSGMPPVMFHDGDPKRAIAASARETDVPSCSAAPCFAFLRVVEPPLRVIRYAQHPRRRASQKKNCNCRSESHQPRSGRMPQRSAVESFAQPRIQKPRRKGNLYRRHQHRPKLQQPRKPVRNSRGHPESAQCRANRSHSQCRVHQKYNGILRRAAFRPGKRSARHTDTQDQRHPNPPWRLQKNARPAHRRSVRTGGRRQKKENREPDRQQTRNNQPGVWMRCKPHKNLGV